RVGTDRKTQDEVFDKSTLHALEKLISDRVIDTMDFPISTGKEGNVFRGTTQDKKFVAVKVYRINTSTFKNMSNYIVGDPRFKSIHNTRRDIIFAWTKKEFKNLERLNRVGVNAPKPIIYKKNVLVMEYIGDFERSAPLMKDVKLENPEERFDVLIDSISEMYKKAELVHGDISAYNVLIYKKLPYIIDLGQGVLIEHPNALEFLKRDIHNVVNYFKKFGILADEGKIFKNVIKKS
ncbi:MAG: serine protein kinase RIO, partial [Thermoplasmatales archaeon]|nr:serine protein kinase RIO [Thermoplasmatales archaeon]